MPALGDSWKNSKDLLSKSFNYNNKVELKTKADNGVTFTAEATFGQPVGGFLKAEYAGKNWKLDKFQLGSDKVVAADFSLLEPVPNTKITFKATDASRERGVDAISSVVGAEYTLPNAAFGADYDVFGQKVDTTTTFNYKNYVFGGSAKLAFAKGFDVADFGAVAGYKTKTVTVAAQADKKFTAGTLAYYQVVNPDVTVGAVAKFPLKFAETKGKVDVEFGAAIKADAATTWTLKANTSGKVAASYAQQLTAATKLTVAAEIDGANLSNDHKLGWTLSSTF